VIKNNETFKLTDELLWAFYGELRSNA